MEAARIGQLLFREQVPCRAVRDLVRGVAKDVDDRVRRVKNAGVGGEVCNAASARPYMAIADAVPYREWTRMWSPLGPANGRRGPNDPGLETPRQCYLRGPVPVTANGTWAQSVPARRARRLKLPRGGACTAETPPAREGRAREKWGQLRPSREDYAFHLATDGPSTSPDGLVTCQAPRVCQEFLVPRRL